ncbi:6-phosphogluconate dehydrogenase [Aspergillus keveii]|uniref:6-phosphogluconate dehydrogenase n=1 Tax=Aspergillus keveii TaxID=714993 RepID=A0ABR4GG27_9EURO
MSPQILVVGTGSIGIVYSMLLTRAGAECSCICRSNYTAATTAGFTVHSTIFGTETFRPKAVYASIEEAVAEKNGNSGMCYDFILVATKAFPSSSLTGDGSSAEVAGSSSSSSSIAASITPLVTATTTLQGQRTAIVLIQNGLGIERDYRARFPHSPIISCVAYLPTTQTAPGIVHHTEVERLQIGVYPRISDRGEGDGSNSKSNSDSKSDHSLFSNPDDAAITARFAALVRTGGATAEIHADIQIARWRKLIGNAAWSPICALARCRDLEFLAAQTAQATPSTSTSESAALTTTATAQPLAREVVQRVMEEVVSVARAAGYAGEIGAADVEMQMARSAGRMWPGVEPSMLADVRAGRRMEVEAVLGGVVRVARAVGVEVPRLECLYTLLLGLDWAMRGGE